MAYGPALPIWPQNTAQAAVGPVANQSRRALDEGAPYPIQSKFISSTPEKNPEKSAQMKTVKSWFVLSNNIKKTKPYIILIILFSSTSVISYSSEYSWHDQQRIAQILLLTICSLHYLVKPDTFKSFSSSLPGLILAIGLISSTISEHPGWAAKEWSIYVGLWALCLTYKNILTTEKSQREIFFIIATVGLILAFNFLTSYLSSIFSNQKSLDADVLFSGFSNPRFFGQFQAILIPTLAHLFFTSKDQRALKLLILATLVLHWCISYLLGGRGLWLSLIIAYTFGLLVTNRALPIINIQILAASLGFFIFKLMFFLIPDQIGATSKIYESLRTGLSARDLLWSAAWEAAQNNLLLGIGPMHLSASINPVAAHPHQVILQWFAEWGLPATFLAVATAIKGIYKGCTTTHTTKNPDDLCILIVLMSLLVLAQVDGVFVMPYTQTWVAIFASIACARWASTGLNVKYPFIVTKGFMLVAAFVLAKTIILEAPNLPNSEKNYYEKNHSTPKPRFWLQGWIPMSEN